MREVVEDLKATADYNGTVAVFCDAYQSRDHSFNLFVDMKRKFIDAGIPAQQVAIIHDYITDAKREALYKQINNGEVRIVLGTTEKLGIGVNMQERLHMLVNLDVPIRPMDYLQRIGRIVRQGNLHLQMDKPVRILRLGVKQTLDVTGYQRLKIKESFITGNEGRGYGTLARRTRNRQQRQHEFRADDGLTLRQRCGARPVARTE